MGIVNLTPDSFSDARPADPVAAARAMIAAGAAVVDLGGESTRPGASEVPLAEERARVMPVLAALAGVPVSIDTRKAAVMAAALDAGAVLVNDVSALTYDPAAMALVAARRCPVVLMHAQGTPATMQAAPTYDDVVADVFDWLEDRIAACVAAGIARARIIADPGIGFGKTAAHNAALLRGIATFHGLGVPLLLGASRKALIPRLTGDDSPVGQRLGGSIALALHGVARGVQIVRVHDVPETVQAVRLWQAVA
jgi:dihydropteroate synthase